LNPPRSVGQRSCWLVLRPRRVASIATAGAAKADDKAGQQDESPRYAMQLREVANKAETSRPELDWARVYLGSNDLSVRAGSGRLAAIRGLSLAHCGDLYSLLKPLLPDGEGFTDCTRLGV